MTVHICPVSGETKAEDRINYITHLVGLFLSLIGAVVLVWTSFSSNLWNCVSCTIYSITLISLYAASTLYHRCECVFRKKTWKIVDHSCIYLLIAGSYTPFTLGPLHNHHGLELFFVVWGITIVGITFKICAIDRFQRLSLVSYLVMGWLITLSLTTLAETLTATSFNWLVAGGLSYTVGTIFYAWKSLPYNHAIWHGFVLGGSICHYFSIFYLQ